MVSPRLLTLAIRIGQLCLGSSASVVWARRKPSRQVQTWTGTLA
jgi:hypothetical protein